MIEYKYFTCPDTDLIISVKISQKWMLWHIQEGA